VAAPGIFIGDIVKG